MRVVFEQAQTGLRVLATGLIVLMALIALGYTLAAALGLLPWLTLYAQFGDLTWLHAGHATQIGITLLLCSLLLYLPATRRVAALERSHRQFQVSMEDVARAYHLAHTADRAGVFSLSSEFDAVRERLAYLRDHPELDRLEPELLELAAQMSHTARDLADIYSDEKVARARMFLRQRQQEAERQQQLIVEAHHALRGIRKWSQQVELEESVVASRLGQLEEQLQATLPALGYTLGRDGANVVPIPDRPAAE